MTPEEIELARFTLFTILSLGVLLFVWGIVREIK